MKSISKPDFSAFVAALTEPLSRTMTGDLRTGDGKTLDALVTKADQPAAARAASFAAICALSCSGVSRTMSSF